MKNVILLIVGISFTAWGTWTIADQLPHYQQKQMAVSDLEAGRPPPGRWLELSGRVLGDDHRIIWPLEGNRATYVPLVSDDWQPSRPIVVFFRAHENQAVPPGELIYHPGPTLVGYVDPAGLPDDIRALFQQNGLTPAPNALVLDYRGTPGDLLFFAGTACLAGLAIIICIGVSLRRKRPKETGP